MKITFNILFILFSTFVFSQSKEEKIASILKNTGTFDSYKSLLFDMEINPIKYGANEKDLDKIKSIEKKLTNEEILKRLSKSISETYTDSEINDIYTFCNSKTGKKFLTSYELLDEKFRNSFKDIHNELQAIQSNDREIDNHKSAPKDKPIAVNKEDGFYVVLNPESKRNDFRDLKLSTQPEIVKAVILDIKGSKDNLGRNIIEITLTKEGARKFENLTKNNIGKPIAIVLNKWLISAPMVIDTIANGRVQIAGDFSDKDVKDFTNSFKK